MLSNEEPTIDNEGRLLSFNKINHQPSAQQCITEIRIVSLSYTHISKTPQQIANTIYNSDALQINSETSSTTIPTPPSAILKITIDGTETRAGPLC